MGLNRSVHKKVFEVTGSYNQFDATVHSGRATKNIFSFYRDWNKLKSEFPIHWNCGYSQLWTLKMDTISACFFFSEFKGKNYGQIFIYLWKITL